MEEKQEGFAGGFGSPQGALFRQKLALDNIRRYRDRYQKTAADLFLSYERKKREEDYVGARNQLKLRGFYLKLQAFVEGVLETFKLIEMNDSLALFLLETADALKTVETETDAKAQLQARRKLEDIARAIAENWRGGKYVRLFPKENPFVKWKRLRSEKKKSPQQLLAETESEYEILA
jgi:hypothetical protein